MTNANLLCFSRAAERKERERGNDKARERSERLNAERGSIISTSGQIIGGFADRSNARFYARRLVPGAERFSAYSFRRDLLAVFTVEYVVADNDGGGSGAVFPKVSHHEETP